MPQAHSAWCPAHFKQPPHLHSHSSPWLLHPLFICPSVINPQPVSCDMTPGPSLKPCTFSHPLCNIHPSHKSHHMLAWFWAPLPLFIISYRLIRNCACNCHLVSITLPSYLSSIVLYHIISRRIYLHSRLLV